MNSKVHVLLDREDYSHVDRRVQILIECMIIMLGYATAQTTPFHQGPFWFIHPRGHRRTATSNLESSLASGQSPHNHKPQHSLLLLKIFYPWRILEILIVVFVAPFWSWLSCMVLSFITDIECGIRSLVNCSSENLFPVYWKESFSQSFCWLDLILILWTSLQNLLNSWFWQEPIIDTCFQLHALQ